MSMMKKMILILPYFGKFPSYFHLFLKSCEANKNYVDFLIFTDNPLVDYENIKVIQIDWESFKKKIQDRFDFLIELPSPYKLCDFKPAYGYIFEEYIKDYAYWGHCDCDLIWGDFRLLYPYLEYDYDRIGIWGHLSLYKNNHTVNRYFKTLSSPKVKDYKTVLSSPKSYSFDEFSGMNILMDENNKPTCKVRLFDDIIFYTRNFWSRREVEGKLDFIPNHSIPIYFEYKKGRLYRYLYVRGGWINDESLYVHLQKRNMSVCTEKDDEYMIFPNVFKPLCHFSKKERLKLAKKTFYDVKYYKMIVKAWVGSRIKNYIKK